LKEGTLLDGTMKPSVNGTGRIKFGTESSGGFRNCTVANCTFRGCRGLALEEVDGGIMENITINNITMMDVPDYRDLHHHRQTQSRQSRGLNLDSRA
jgi:polygalacturonase